MDGKRDRPKEKPVNRGDALFEFLPSDAALCGLVFCVLSLLRVLRSSLHFERKPCFDDPLKDPEFSLRNVSLSSFSSLRDASFNSCEGFWRLEVILVDVSGDGKPAVLSAHRRSNVCEPKCKSAWACYWECATVRTLSHTSDRSRLRFCFCFIFIGIVEVGCDYPFGWKSFPVRIARRR